MKNKLIAIVILILMSSCGANKNLGYRVYPLEGAYYPRRILYAVGPIKIIDIQIVKRK